MEPSINDIPLSPENARFADSIWQWFVTNGLTTKEKPCFIATDPEFGEKESGHSSGLIIIDEAQGKECHPLGAIILEEVLHYVAGSDRPETSADFSPEFVNYIFALAGSDERITQVCDRHFQSVAIRKLYDRIRPGLGLDEDCG